MDTNSLGEKLKELRIKRKRSLLEVATAVSIDKAYLSKIENGLRKPSRILLDSLLKYYSLTDIAEYNILHSLAGYPSIVVEPNLSHDTVNPKRKEVSFMQNSQKVPVQENVEGQVTVPNGLHVLFSDVAYVTTNPHGVIFDFGQTMGPTNNQTIVSRIGMSKEHARALMKVLSDKLVELELSQKKKEGN